MHVVDVNIPLVSELCVDTTWYLCMIREGVDTAEVNAAFTIHAVYIHNQWFKNGLCKQATDMKELIYPLVRPNNNVSIEAGVTFVDFNLLVVCAHQSTHVLKDSAGAVIDAEEICTYSLEYDADSNNRMNNAYRVYKPQFMKKMSDLFDTLVVRRKADLHVLDTLTDKFVDAVNLHTSQLVTAATSNNFNRGFAGMAPSKAFAKSLKNADFQINRSTSNETRAKIEKKRQETIQKPGMINSQQEVYEHEDEVQSDGENIPPAVLSSQRQSQRSNCESSEPIESLICNSRYSLRTVLKNKINDDPNTANNGWFGQPKKRKTK